MSDRIRVQIDDGHGTTALIADRAVLSSLTRREQIRLRALVDGVVAELRVAGGWDASYARQCLLAEVARQYADELAYERVCERKGLLL